MPKHTPSDSPETPVSANAENANTANLTAFNSSASPITTDGLLSLIASMSQQLLASQKAAADQAAAAALANDRLAAAILKTTEPREALKTRQQLAQEENDKLFDAQAKELRRRQLLNKQVVENDCVHIAGCSQLSEQKDIAGRTAIVWHRTDAQCDVGICTVCGRQFHPDDEIDSLGHTYNYWRKQPSFNKLSAAGFRQFDNPSKARTDSYLRDETEVAVH